MWQATICLLIKENLPAGGKKELLLAMKKRGFGVGKWNGVGGKLDSEKGDKDIVDTAIRETKEEIGVKIKDLEKVAVLNFYFPYNQAWDQDVHVFLVRDWKGAPKETEEMMPKWFKAEEIPFGRMWDDDKFWLPQVLSGKKVKGEFIFKEGERVSEKNVKIVENI